MNTTTTISPWEVKTGHILIVHEDGLNVEKTVVATREKNSMTQIEFADGTSVWLNGYATCTKK